MDDASEPVRITEGTEVYGADGERIGMVTAVDAETAIVEEGMLSPGVHTVPLTAFARVEEGVAYLAVPRADALKANWAATAPLGTGRAGMTLDTDAAIEHRQDSDRTHQNTADGLVVEIHEEDLTATTRTREIGEVRIERDVVSEERLLEVPIVEERLRVARHAVDRPLESGETAFQKGKVIVPIQGEEVELEATARVAEEVEITKEEVERTDQVTGTVRREEVRVSETGVGGVVGDDEPSDPLPPASTS